VRQTYRLGDGAERMATLTVWKFEPAAGAQQALGLLQRLQKEKLIKINDAAYVYWPRGGRSRRPSSSTTSPGSGRSGAAWGLLFGLIFFVPLLGMTVGAAMGALSGSLADVGIDDDFIRLVRDNVTPARPDCS
jgi:uncharacterized membrane protein